MTIFPFKKKLTSIRYAYGEQAVTYFTQHPLCETCGEERICVLNIHHIDGKSINNFKTLCHNCHMIEHNQHLAHETYASYLLQLEDEQKSKEVKNARILVRLEEAMPIRDIITTEKTSISTIKKVMETHGFVSEDRKGYKKM